MWSSAKRCSRRYAHDIWWYQSDADALLRRDVDEACNVRASVSQGVDGQYDKTRCDEIDSEPQYEAGAKNNALRRCFVCASAAALLWTRGDRSKVHNGPICKLSSSSVRLAQLFIHWIEISHHHHHHGHHHHHLAIHRTNKTMTWWALSEWWGQCKSGWVLLSPCAVAHMYIVQVRVGNVLGARFQCIRCTFSNVLGARYQCIRCALAMY